MMMLDMVDGRPVLPSARALLKAGARGALAEGGEDSRQRGGEWSP
jgi:hypothetical protein